MKNEFFRFFRGKNWKTDSRERSDSIMNHLINQFNAMLTNAMQTYVHCSLNLVLYGSHPMRKKLPSFIYLFCLLHLRRKKKSEKYGIESTRLITMENYLEICCVLCVCHFLRSCWFLLAI